jgi:hypothetical protein
MVETKPTMVVGVTCVRMYAHNLWINNGWKPSSIWKLIVGAHMLDWAYKYKFVDVKPEFRGPVMWKDLELQDRMRFGEWALSLEEVPSEEREKCLSNTKGLLGLSYFFSELMCAEFKTDADKTRKRFASSILYPKLMMGYYLIRVWRKELRDVESMTQEEQHELLTEAATWVDTGEEQVMWLYAKAIWLLSNIL